NKLLHNDGNQNFSRIENVITSAEEPYTVGTWYDYDLDGDDDLFIGSGPANGTVAPDFIYKNLFAETGSDSFSTSVPSIFFEPRDGQVWNLVDFDNDGDFDA